MLRHTILNMGRHKLEVVQANDQRNGQIISRLEHKTNCFFRSKTLGTEGEKWGFDLASAL